jgi:hypothetical protein
MTGARHWQASVDTGGLVLTIAPAKVFRYGFMKIYDKSCH